MARPARARDEILKLIDADEDIALHGAPTPARSSDGPGPARDPIFAARSAASHLSRCRSWIRAGSLSGTSENRRARRVRPVPVDLRIAGRHDALELERLQHHIEGCGRARGRAPTGLQPIRTERRHVHPDRKATPNLATLTFLPGRVRDWRADVRRARPQPAPDVRSLLGNAFRHPRRPRAWFLRLRLHHHHQGRSEQGRGRVAAPQAGDSLGAIMEASSCRASRSCSATVAPAPAATRTRSSSRTTTADTVATNQGPARDLGCAPARRRRRRRIQPSAAYRDGIVYLAMKGPAGRLPVGPRDP